MLSRYDNVFLLPPLGYLEFQFLLYKSFLVITDSGGIQEEAPSFGKPVFVTRETTERQEAIQMGLAKLVGTDTQLIVDSVSEIIDQEDKYNAMLSDHNPFGDGNASQRIVDFFRDNYCQ